MTDTTDRDAAPAAAEGADRWTLAISEVWSLYYRWRDDPKRGTGDAEACLRVIERLEAARPAPPAAPREGGDRLKAAEAVSPAGVASVPTVDAAAVLASHWRDQDSEWDITYCAVCLRLWSGDAETGGCPEVLLAREVVALRERAEALEEERDRYGVVADVDDALKVLRAESKHLDIDAEGMLVAEWGFKLGWRLRAAAPREGDLTALDRMEAWWRNIAGATSLPYPGWQDDVMIVLRLAREAARGEATP